MYYNTLETKRSRERERERERGNGHTFYCKVERLMYNSHNSGEKEETKTKQKHPSIRLYC
jgi:hypothetical protein